MWLELSNDEIKEAVNSGRLLSLFSVDCRKVLGDIPCLNCKGWQEKLNLFKSKYKAMSENKCEYRLKAKYNGILGISNDKITNKEAQMLLSKHPRGIDLFVAVPSEPVLSEAEQREQKRKAELKLKTLEQLREKAESIGLSSKGSKKELINSIYKLESNGNIN